MSPVALLAAPRRLTRAVVLSCAVATAGTGVHAAAGGAVSLVAALGCALVLVGPAWWLAGHERGWATIAAAELGGQELVHLLHEYLAQTGPGAMVPHDVMFYGHVGVAGLIAVWLRRGERRVWAAARRAFRAVVEAWRALAALSHRSCVATPVTVPATPEPLLPAGRMLRHSVLRRGPPLVV